MKLSLCDMKDAFSRNFSIGGNVSTFENQLFSCHHVTMRVIGNAPCADGVAFLGAKQPVGTATDRVTDVNLVNPCLHYAETLEY